MKIPPGPKALVAILLVLSTLASWLLLYHAAYWEPFYVYETSDALLYVGLPCALMTLLIGLAGIIVYSIVTRRFSPWWSGAVLWVIFLLGVSADIPRKWTRDQEHFHRSLPSSIESR